MLLRSEGLGDEVWQRESITNLHPMRLASGPFSPCNTLASVVQLYRAVSVLGLTGISSEIFLSSFARSLTYSVSVGVERACCSDHTQ